MISFCDGLFVSRVRPSGLPHGDTAGRPPDVATLTTAERMVDGVHRHATGLRALAPPAVAAGLADLHQLVLGVADGTDGGAAVDQHAAHLGGRHAQRGVVAVLGDELHCDAGRPADLAALAGTQLDVVHGGADRDVAQRHGVARLDVGAVAALDVIADAQTLRRQDVGLLAVAVVQEGDAAGAVGVVLDGGDLGRDAVLDALEVDLAVLLLVAAAAVARRLAAVSVAATGLRLRVEQRLLGRRLGDVGEVGHGLEATAGAGGFAGANTHHVLSSRTAGSRPLPT